MTQKSEHLLIRRSVLKAGLSVVVVGATAGFASTASAAADSKMEPSLVMYQDTPKNGLRCDQCAQWEAPDGCKVVKGKISPEGWCAAFAPAQ